MPQIPEDLFLSMTDIITVLKPLIKLRPCKTSSPDSLTTFLLKDNVVELAPTLTRIFQPSLGTLRL